MSSSSSSELTSSTIAGSSVVPAGAFAIAESSVTAGLSSCTQISGTGRDGRTHFACAFIATVPKRGSTLSSFPRSPNSGLQRQLCRDIQLQALFCTTDRRLQLHFCTTDRRLQLHFCTTDRRLQLPFCTTDRPTNRPTDQAMHASTLLQKLTFTHKPSQRTLCTQSRA